jgi:hypothetical protein
MSSYKAVLPFLGVGKLAPPPTGKVDLEMKQAMSRESQSTMFRTGVQFWSRLFFWRQFNWNEFEQRFESCECRQYEYLWHALRSLGWAGRSDTGTWLFGVYGYRMPVYGSQVMRHELFHGAQDVCSEMFSNRPGFVGAVCAELSAQTFGSPLIGLPGVYGMCGFIGIMVYRVGNLLLS